MKDETRHCPNCSAPVEIPVGETKAVCHFCESRLRFLPEAGEMEVVRTREEMKYRERVAVRQIVLQQQLQKEEAEAWRRTAAQVAISAAPLLGAAVARGVFHLALGRRPGCIGCGCLLPLLTLFALAAALLFAALS